MNSDRFFKEGTVISIAQGSLYTLLYDAQHFGFLKNGKPNLSGFLNALLPALAAMRNDMHQRYLDKFENEADARKVENGIYDIYLSTFDVGDDSLTKIPLRINKGSQKAFMDIHDHDLEKYGMDFSPFLKSLIDEYSMRALYQREECFYWQYLSALRKAIDGETSLTVHLSNGEKEIFPCTLEISPITNSCHLFGLDHEGKDPIEIPLASVLHMKEGSKTHSYSQQEYDLVSEKIKKYWDDEEKEYVR